MFLATVCRVRSIRVQSLTDCGEIYRKLGQCALSAAKYRELIALTPRRADNAVGLGRTLLLMGDTQDAEEQFKMAIDFGLKIGAPYYYWGEMLATKGDHVGAITKYKRALELDPKWGEPYARWGESLAALGHKTAVNEKFAKVLELEPKHPDFQKYRTAR